MGGELAAVGTLSLKLGFGSLGAGSFGVGQGALGLDLSVAAVAKSVTLAGGVVADALSFGAGVGLGLPCPAYLSFSSGPGVTNCG